MEEQKVHNFFWQNEASSSNFMETPATYQSFAELLLYTDNSPIFDISHVYTPADRFWIDLTLTIKNKDGIDWRKEGF